jgi:hypothetical protein
MENILCLLAYVRSELEETMFRERRGQRDVSVYFPRASADPGGPVGNAHPGGTAVPHGARSQERATAVALPESFQAKADS